MKRLIHIASEYFGVPDEAVHNPTVYRDRSSRMSRYAVAVVMFENGVSPIRISDKLGYSGPGEGTRIIRAAQKMMNQNHIFAQTVKKIKAEWMECTKKRASKIIEESGEKGITVGDLTDALQKS